MPVTVLVVDADPRSSADWEALLSDQGYDVIAARTGEAALTLCSSVRPDVVLLYDLLPDMHGLEVCRRLKADPRNRLTPIILHAATADFSDAARAVGAGADDFWSHGPTPWESLSRLHSLLQMKTLSTNRRNPYCFLSRKALKRGIRLVGAMAREFPITPCDLERVSDWAGTILTRYASADYSTTSAKSEFLKRFFTRLVR